MRLSVVWPVRRCHSSSATPTLSAMLLLLGQQHLGFGFVDGHDFVDQAGGPHRPQYAQGVRGAQLVDRRRMRKATFNFQAAAVVEQVNAFVIALALHFDEDRLVVDHGCGVDELQANALLCFADFIAFGFGDGSNQDSGGQGRKGGDEVPTECVGHGGVLSF
jgi:hypothetical protein